MAGVGSHDLFALADEYLEAVVAALVDTPGGVPDLTFVSPGVPSWDCPEMVAVYVGAAIVADTFPLQPSLEPAFRVTVQGEVDMIQLTATVLRCVPTVDDFGQAPSAAGMSAAAQQTCADLWAVWNHVKAAKRAGTLFPPRERELLLDPAVSLNQQGGAAGWQIPIRVNLQGYRPT